MSLLPQSKKSAEEIAKLRESLGIPGLPAETPPSPEPEVFAEAAPPAPWPQQTHSLKKAEWIPAIPAPEPNGPEEVPAETTPQVVRAKPIRSLRKSEQIPVLVVPRHDTPPPDSKLPAYRHNENELREISRHAALEMVMAAPNPKLAKAHLALVIPGYLASVAGAVCFYFYEQPIGVSASCVGISLLIATFIFFRKPISRHHAAFIAVFALFVIISGTLHYFPKLQYAT